jgi:hypothetical protein
LFSFSLSKFRKKMLRPLILFSFLLLVCACTTLQQVVTDTMNSGSGNALSSEEVARGLKEALQVGIGKGADRASLTDGFFGNSLIKILFPPEAQRVEAKLRQIGLGNQVDKFVLALNRGAEDAAREAKPIFVSAIQGMSIQDAWGILRGNGNGDAATQYLQRVTTSQLETAFRPHIRNSLEKTSATRYYSDIVNIYNKIPGVQKANPDLETYATQKATEGLFKLVSQEEAKIRANPIERTTDLLKKVFAQAGR